MKPVHWNKMLQHPTCHALLTVWIVSLLLLLYLILRHFNLPLNKLATVAALAALCLWRLWAWGAFAVLLSVALICLPMRLHPLGAIEVREMRLLSNLLLATAALAHVVAHFRCIDLVRRSATLPSNLNVADVSAPVAIVGPNARERQTTIPAMKTSFEEELLRIVGLLPVWPVAALLVWRYFPDPWSAAEFFAIPQPILVLFLLSVVMVGSGIGLSRLVLWYVGRYGLSRDQAELELNDVVWRELQSETRHIGRAMGRAKRRA